MSYKKYFLWLDTSGERGKPKWLWVKKFADKSELRPNDRFESIEECIDSYQKDNGGKPDPHTFIQPFVVYEYCIEGVGQGRYIVAEGFGDNNENLNSVRREILSQIKQRHNIRVKDGDIEVEHVDFRGDPGPWFQFSVMIVPPYGSTEFRLDGDYSWRRW